ncbi:MAG TPA: NAD(P)-dependent oxidoreductase [Chitinophagaceae bacterium]|jgi:nucleoside-diphosphate-sugar epimerase|nr:NAD(P)-dependent oxidoreductase [Chitinophagaceae bacterium]
MRIGIIGGSSQVGASLALYFKMYTEHEVVAFVRSSYSRVFFDLCQLETQAINLGNNASLSESLASLDLIIDCSYPAGQLHSILPSIRKNVQAVLAAMPAKAVFVYMSSIMAYGMPDGQVKIAHYRLPRTAYAFIKRRAESYIEQVSRKFNKTAYSFRLGQVHGFLQSVNESFKEKLAAHSTAYITGSPDDLTNTIFISSLGDAILKCGNRELSPGVYTLVSQPQWTLKELYGYYLSMYNIDTDLVFMPISKNVKRKSLFPAGLMAFLKKHRPLLETYILMQLPKMAVKFKGRFRQSEVYRVVNERADQPSIDFNLLGKPGLQTVTGISSDVQEVTRYEKEMELFYTASLNKAMQ